MVRKCLTQSANAMETLGENERCPRFEPIYARVYRNASSAERFLNMNEV
jgi:hypothetical protein